MTQEELDELVAIASRHIATWPEWKRLCVEDMLTNNLGTRTTPQAFVNNNPDNDGY